MYSLNIVINRFNYFIFVVCVFIREDFFIVCIVNASLMGEKGSKSLKWEGIGKR